MKRFEYLALAAIVGACLFVTTPKTEAQVSVGINVGPAPDCPYGYYDYAPYACAPYGYYGPEWFTSGVFIGVGPWFHGPDNFRGHVDNHFDVKHGYKGPAGRLGINLSRQSVPITLLTSKGMKCAMGAATPPTTRAESSGYGSPKICF
jgi:hypothetical protein